MRKFHQLSIKNAAAFLIFLFIFTLTTFAQTPQYYNLNTGTSSNSFPFNVAGGKAVNSLFLAGEFAQPTPCPPGQKITVVYFRTSTAGTRTYTNLHILMAQSTITTLTSGSFYAGPWDTVYFNASATLSSTVGGWMAVTLTTPYNYDPTKSLITFVGHCGATGTNGSVYNSTLSDIRRVWSVGGCPFVAYASGDGSMVNFGIDVVPAAVTGWTAQTSGITTSLNTVSAVNSNVGWIGGNGGVVLRTTNGGTNWTNVTGAPIGTSDVYAICGLDANTCLVSTSPAATYVFKTTNGGANWTQVFTQAGGFIDDIKFQNATTGFMYGDPVSTRWSLWKTTNAGTTWDSAGLYLAQVGSEAGWNNAMWLSGNNLWFGTNNTKVYKSTNFGATGSWTAGVTTGSVNTYSVAFNGNKGFTGQTIALTSTDAGTTWGAQTFPGTGTIYSINSVSGRFWYARGAVIYWSSDNGANFASQYTGTGTYQAMNLVLDANTIRGWAVSATGGIIAYNELITGISVNPGTVPENYALLQNYPNPFNPSTKISFSLPKSGIVDLRVYDVLGREVAVLVNEMTQAGTHSVDFNASELSSGVYFYTLRAGDFTNTKKMLLIK